MINKVVNNSKTYELAFSGDLVLDLPDPDHWLGGLAPMLEAVDLAIGHLEVPHTRRGRETSGDVPAPGADPAALAALARCGFDAVTLAGNHINDQGREGIEDTLAALAEAGVAACGAGRDLAEARRPAWLSLGPHSVAVLSYNCVGPESSWAADAAAGCAYLPLATADGSAVTPLAPIIALTKAARDILRQDIVAVREQADLVVVALHKGIVHTPAVLAPYERPVAHAAIDAGADVVVGHHAHIVRGIEIYRGKPVFHGLGNGCVVTRALTADQSHPRRAEWARRRRELFGFEPDPAYEFAPFHPEAVNAMLGRVSWRPGGTLEAGLLPVYVEPPGRPVAAGSRAGGIVDYVARITRDGGLPPVAFTPAASMWVLQ
ncbi:MAG TPA: CapA family protein [Woeseiaceae bacterium]|nr:CapA family protein [Woeseiaceae bacterium]